MNTIRHFQLFYNRYYVLDIKSTETNNNATQKLETVPTRQSGLKSGLKLRIILKLHILISIGLRTIYFMINT